MGRVEKSQKEPSACVIRAENKPDQILEDVLSCSSTEKSLSGVSLVLLWLVCIEMKRSWAPITWLVKENSKQQASLTHLFWIYCKQMELKQTNKTSLPAHDYKHFDTFPSCVCYLYFVRALWSRQPDWNLWALHVLTFNTWAYDKGKWGRLSIYTIRELFGYLRVSELSVE